MHTPRQTTSLLIILLNKHQNKRGKQSLKEVLRTHHLQKRGERSTCEEPQPRLPICQLETWLDPTPSLPNDFSFFEMNTGERDRSLTSSQGCYRLNGHQATTMKRSETHITVAQQHLKRDRNCIEGANHNIVQSAKEKYFTNTVH